MNVRTHTLHVTNNNDTLVYQQSLIAAVLQVQVTHINTLS